MSLADEWLSTSKTESIDQGACGSRTPHGEARSSAKKGALSPPFSPVVPQAVMPLCEPHSAAEGRLKLYLQTALSKDCGGTCPDAHSHRQQ